MIKTALLYSCIFFLSTSNVAFGKMRCSKDSFCLEVIDNAGIKEFYGINKKSFYITAQVELKLENMTYVDKKEHLNEVPPHSKALLFSLKQKDSNKKWNYRYKYYWNKGSFTASHPSTVRYRLPYDAHKHFKISQSCNGNFTHNKSSSQYALDFSMPEGTAVLAARAGKVVDLYEYSIIGGTSQLDYRFGNFVLIQHEDMTLGGYYHLKTMGAAVSIGQQVQAGQLIGYSGNTGYSRGPPLHFVVQRPKSGRIKESLKVTFSTDQGDVSCPPKGTLL